jgi:hypothetical protein
MWSVIEKDPELKALYTNILNSVDEGTKEALEQNLEGLITNKMEELEKGGYTNELFQDAYGQYICDEREKLIEAKAQQQFQDSVADAYGDNAKNYAYTYKPEATQIDPEIDPNEEHIGIMAQDIEKINPACIKETPEGVKTVDTGRLALMNAGAIGDLARRLKALEERVNG